MIKKPSTRKRSIDLDGPEGNAFALLGLAKRWCRELGYNDEYAKKLSEEMTSGDYKTLVQVFDREFGSICDLETNQKDLLR